jgi:hypothetical protein
MPKKLPEIPPLKDLKFRKTLSLPALLKRVRESFGEIKDPCKNRTDYSLQDILMSGLAVFGLKHASLLSFDNDRDKPRTRHNLQHLYGVKDKAPSDTPLRKVLDETAPEVCRPATVGVIQELQRQGELEPFRYLGGYLVSQDGTGHSSSSKIKCPDCCEKHHRNGKTEYYHQLLASVIVHPDKKIVLPLFHEPIKKSDGDNKNDCERNAAKRLLPALKKGFPRLKMILLEDALAANGPHIKDLRANGFSHITRVKYGSNKSLMNHAIERMAKGKTDEFEAVSDDGILRGYRFINQIPLNKTHQKLLVNYLEYWEVDQKGKTKNFSWITDITLSRDNVYYVMRAGRARWKIENETFNTLKNLGYNFEHNYGHGKKHLATVFATLMMLVFLIDQVQELGCKVFNAARYRYYSKVKFWEKLRAMFTEHYIQDWESLYMGIIFGVKENNKLCPNYPDTS